MPEFVQIEKSELEEIFSRMSYLKKVFITFFERVRNKEPDDWLTLQELCEFLHISESKARSLKKSGRIGFIKSGKGSMFLAGDAFGLLERVEAVPRNGNNIYP